MPAGLMLSMLFVISVIGLRVRREVKDSTYMGEGSLGVSFVVSVVTIVFFLFVILSMVSTYVLGGGVRGALGGVYWATRENLEAVLSFLHII